MGNYDREFQWRMMQPHNSYSYTPYTNISTCNQRTDEDSRQLANSHPYFLEDRTHSSSVKRPSIVPTTRTPDYTLPVPLPTSASLYPDYEHTTASQPTVSEAGWEYNSPLPVRRCTSTPYSPLHTSSSTSSSLPSPSALLNRPSLSLSSPTVVYGGMVDPLISEYTTNSFYPVWNGAGSSGIGEHDTTTPTDFNGLGSLPSVSVATTTSLDPVIVERNEGDEEMKMEYHPLAALNQGDLDYIYGSMDALPSTSTGSSHVRDGQPSQRYYFPMMDRFKRENSPIVSTRHSTGVSVPSSSGFRSLARNGGSFELKQRAQVQTAASSVDAGTTNAHKRPRSRQCDFPGCVNRARSHQKCKKHGGAHVCEHEGCTKNSQSRGLCIAHGGGSRCKVDGCTRASQSKGLCKSHGGGEYCAVENCRKKAHLKHLCRNHGGGVRCKNPKCIKWAQRKGWCMAHSKEVFGH